MLGIVKIILQQLKVPERAPYILNCFDFHKFYKIIYFLKQN